VCTTSMGLTSNSRVAIAGTVSARPPSPATDFPPSHVREAFAAVDSGAQLAVYVHGRRVVVYSSTKGAATLVVALLVQDGALELDRPVADCWPEFAAAGKVGSPCGTSSATTMAIA